MQYIKFHEDVPDLGYAKLGDAGLDLTAQEFACLAPFGDKDGNYKKLISTGIAVKIPEGHFGMLVPRSSMGKRGIALANTVGIIDSGYTGEIKLFIQNMTPDAQFIEFNERIAQLIVVPYAHIALSLVQELPTTERGEDGFGSSGR
jgi:deoxyuridine 5'-triphosphate nucleotidohydrolase